MTKDEQAIREGVELAPGWEWTESKHGTTFSRHFGEPGSLEYKHDFISFWISDPECDEDVRFGLAALAADLRDTVNATGAYYVNCYPNLTVVERRSIDYQSASRHKGDNCDMNTIHAVVKFYRAHPEFKP